MNKNLKNTTLAAMFLALGLLLPFLTGQIPEFGNMLLPMHIPVLLCGLICGWQYGGIIGFICPLMRNFIFHAPPMPGAISMAFELATYGIVIGLLYSLSKRKSLASLYLCMIASMLAGRVVWGAVNTVVMGAAGNEFGFKIFMTEAFVKAVPGIILQLILIPAVMVALRRTGLVHSVSGKGK